MHCSEFLSHYSAFRDGVIADPQLQGALEQHLAACANCTRYHRSVARGVDLLRFQDAIEPSPDFRRRLHGRLVAASVNETVMPGRASIAAALMFASALTLGVYEISQRHGRSAGTVVARASRPPAQMPYAVAPRQWPESDFTLAAFKHRAPQEPVEVVERTPVALGAWTSLPR